MLVQMTSTPLWVRGQQGDYMLYAIGVNDSGVALVSVGVETGFAKR